MSPEALNDHKALHRDVQQAAVAVISDEPDQFLQSQRLRLMAEELGCPISERNAATYLARARGEISGVTVPRMKGERMDTTYALGMGGDHGRHIQPAGSAEGPANQRLV